ncbi:prepilin peptidase [Micromonospora aurantiaca (nom. illeg.)]|uniref:prepilin peptidase n=1 Tax=Micromonospora aurantiaca (nom. illeg.) TaxID=47850 RepID=UPI00340F0E17
MTTTTAARRIGIRMALPALAVVPLLRHTIAVHVVPDDQPWRTACPCGKPLWPHAIGPSGRCARCGVRVGAPPYAVEAATLAGAAGLAVSGLGGFTLAAYTVWTAAMIVLTFVDAAVMRLPHRITAAATAGFLGLLALGGPAGAWVRAVAAGLLLAAFFAVLAAVSRGQLGWGDVTVAVPLAAALGWHSWTAVYAGVLLGLGTAALTAITLRHLGRLAPGTSLPLGPFLIAAAYTVAVWP